MKMTYWSYAGPAHIGTLRITSSFRNVHAVMHAPLGDDYFNVMRSMLAREDNFTPVTASVVDRNVLASGSQEKVVENIVRKNLEEHADLMVITPTCTSSILQEDLQNFSQRAAFKCQTTNLQSSHVLLADVNHYRVNEFEAADQTLTQVVQFYCQPEKLSPTQRKRTQRPSVNILGIVDLGFHHEHDEKELRELFESLGIDVHVVLPKGATTQDLQSLPQAWFNFVPYREIGLGTAEYLATTFKMPFISRTPIGLTNTAACVKEIIDLLAHQVGPNDSLRFPSEQELDDYLYVQTTKGSRSAWFSRSIDCQNLTGRKAVVFGDATHAAAVTRILACEMGVRVSCAGTYCTQHAEWFEKEVEPYCDEILITEDHVEVQETIHRHSPAAIFGTQMERHIGKSFGIPCGVISAPVHIQNFPVGYHPFVGFEGANQICDLVYNSFTLGMEEHLLEIFGGHDTRTEVSPDSGLGPTVQVTEATDITWSPEAQRELQRIPGFVRQKIKLNVEHFARKIEKVDTVSVKLMCDAQAYFGSRRKTITGPKYPDFLKNRTDKKSHKTSQPTLKPMNPKIIK